MDNQFYKDIIMNSKIGYAYHKILYDDRGVPYDYEFIEVNPTFEAITGLKAIDIIGKRVTEVVPGIEKDAFDWIGTYGDIALHDGKKDFDQYSGVLKKWYRVSAYSPEKYYFATDFFDITHEIQQNDALKELVHSSERLLRMEGDAIDFTQVAEDCRRLAQARFVFFSTLSENGNTEIVVGMAGEQAEKIRMVIPHFIRRSRELFSADLGALEENQILVRLTSLRELADLDIPEPMIASLADSMDLGEAVMIRIATKNRILGYFTAIMPSGKPFERAEIVETFVRQVGTSLLRVEAEQRLKDAQMLLRSSLESPQDMIILSIDRNYNYYYFNQAHKNAMKVAYGKDVSAGMNLLDAVTSEADKAHSKHNYDLAMSGVSHSTIEMYGDTQVSTYESFYNPIRNDKNEIVGATAFARDISKRIQAENALKDSEERFQLLFNQAPLGYQSLDINGYFLDVNQQWLNLLGYEHHEVIGRWFGDFLSEEYREPFRKRFEVFKQRGRIRSEFEMMHKDGTKLFIEFDGLIGVDQNQKFKQTHCILNDITKRKQAEDALKESEEKYRLLYSAMSQGLALHEIITDDAGKPIDYVFLDINESYTKLLGVTREASIGRRIREVMPKVEQYWIDTFGHVALTGEPMYYENYLATTDRYYATYSYSPKPRQFAVLVSDITDRRKKEAEILYISNYDHLTGLPNRRHFESELGRFDVPDNLPLTICMADINGLKLINDSFGHEAGDAHIKMVADIMKSLLRPTDPRPHRRRRIRRRDAADRQTGSAADREQDQSRDHGGRLQPAEDLDRHRIRYEDGFRSGPPGNLSDGRKPHVPAQTVGNHKSAEQDHRPDHEHAF